MNHSGSLLRSCISRSHFYKSKVGLAICIFASFAVKLMLQSTGHTLETRSAALVAFSHAPSFAKICLHIVF